jgi:hypothetical protein
VSDAREPAPAIERGSLIEAVIEDVVDDYDFTARLVRVLDRPVAAPRASRALPLAPSSAEPTTMGAFGR